MSRYESSVSSLGDMPMSATRRTREVTTQANVGVPLYVSVFAAFISSVLLFPIGAWEWSWQVSLGVVGILAAVAFGVVFWLVFRVAGTDEQAWHAIQPMAPITQETQRYETSIEASFVQENGTRQTQYLVFNEPPELVQELFRDALRGDREHDNRHGILPYSDWTGAGKPLTRGRMKVFKDHLLDMEWAEMTDNNTMTLMPKGRLGMEKWLEARACMCTHVQDAETHDAHDEAGD